MILLMLFGLVFLVGVSLFAALVGTSLLKKNARVIRMPGPSRTGPAFPERAIPGYARSEQHASFGGPVAGHPPAPPHRGEPADYDRRYRREYREELGETREEVEARAGQEEARQPSGGAGPSVAAPQPFPLPPVSEGSRGGATGAWVVAVVLALVLFSGALYITLRGWPAALTGPRLYFCEYVDFARQKPVNRSDTFTRGNVTLFVKSPRRLDMNSARIEIYRLGEQQEPYAEKTVPLRPSWTSFAVQVLFEHTGNYRVGVLREDGTPLGIGRLAIVPDTYAYTPVPVEELPEGSPSGRGNNP
jgi:hypothetical protein